MTKLIPNYKHLVQKPDLCGPACLQMILFRRGIWIDQEEIGVKTGVKIISKDKDKFVLKLKITKNQKEAGLFLKEFKESKIKNFLKKYKLKPEVYKLSEIKELENFITKNLEQNNDIIANFWWKPINGIDYGHFVLISEFNRNNKQLTLCDPNPKSKSFWKINLYKLIKGMTSEFDGRERGFAIISLNK